MFPWQTTQWQHLQRLKQERALPHALLFTGIAGTGKAVFADDFTRALLCQSNANVPCNACHSCRLIIGKTHPNVLWLTPEKKGQAIKIDQIRAVNEFVYQSALQGDYRIVVIHPANAMNAHAANALLKTLEEPASGAFFLLISDQTQQLPATILSRCQRLAFPAPSVEAALQWLKSQLTDASYDAELLLNLANGAPLAALQLIQDDVLSLRQALVQALFTLTQQQDDPLKWAAKVQALDELQCIDFMLSWLIDVLRLQSQGDVQQMTNTDCINEIAQVAKQTNIKNNVKFMDELQKLRGQLTNGINLNKQLLIESLLIKWAFCHK